MTISARSGRIAGGLAVIAMLGVFAARLLPVYLKNFHLQQYLEETAQLPATLERPDALLRVDVVNRAARLGLPVRIDQVRVRRWAGHVRIEVLYIVPVNLLFYTVDLHFRPAAGG